MGKGREARQTIRNESIANSSIPPLFCLNFEQTAGIFYFATTLVRSFALVVASLASDSDDPNDSSYYILMRYWLGPGMTS
mgnify:CR=1 FL=1